MFEDGSIVLLPENIKDFSKTLRNLGLGITAQEMKQTNKAIQKVETMTAEDTKVYNKDNTLVHEKMHEKLVFPFTPLRFVAFTRGFKSVCLFMACPTKIEFKLVENVVKKIQHQEKDFPASDEDENFKATLALTFSELNLVEEVCFYAENFISVNYSLIFGYFEICRII